MDANIVLLIVAVLLIAASIFVYFANKKIANELYIRLFKPEESVDENGLRLSPYSIKREYSSISACDKYYILKGTAKLDTETFWSLSSAVKSMNELEKIGGFKQTKL